mgnify:CR=1 FL=1
MIKQYLIFSRIHTASLTIPVVMISYLIYGRDLWTLFLLSVFALLFHAFGFMWNNIFDYKYDKIDKYKQHFPLISGEINIKHAIYIASIGTVLTYLFGTYITYHHLVSFIFMNMAILFGFLYNIYNKKMSSSSLYISMSFASLIPMSMYLNDGVSTIVSTMMFFIAFLTMMYQISVSGNIKDMEVPQANLMKKLGVRLFANNIVFSNKAIAYSTVLRIMVFELIISLFYILSMKITSVVILTAMLSIPSLLFIITMIYHIKMINHARWDRDAYLSYMSKIEIFNYLTFATIIIPVLSIYAYLFFVLFPILWFAIFNRIMWGTVSFPKV